MAVSAETIRIGVWVKITAVENGPIKPHKLGVALILPDVESHEAVCPSLSSLLVDVLRLGFLVAKKNVGHVSLVGQLAQIGRKVSQVRIGQSILVQLKIRAFKQGYFEYSSVYLCCQWSLPPILCPVMSSDDPVLDH